MAQKIFPWLEKVYNHRLKDFIRGNSEKRFRDVMTFFLSCLMKYDVQSLSNGSLKLLKKEIVSFNSWCHMKRPEVKSTQEGTFHTTSEITYEDLVAAILSVYVDIILCLSKNMSEKKISEESINLCAKVFYLLSPRLEFAKDVLLQSTVIDQSHFCILAPLCRKCLTQTAKVNADSYTKHLALHKKLSSLWPEQLSKELVVASRVNPPKNYLKWVRSKSPAIFHSLKVERTDNNQEIRNHFINHVTPDVLNSLLNRISQSLESCQIEGNFSFEVDDSLVSQITVDSSSGSDDDDDDSNKNRGDDNDSSDDDDDDDDGKEYHNTIANRNGNTTSKNIDSSDDDNDSDVDYDGAMEVEPSSSGDDRNKLDYNDALRISNDDDDDDDDTNVEKHQVMEVDLTADGEEKSETSSGNSCDLVSTRSDHLSSCCDVTNVTGKMPEDATFPSRKSLKRKIDDDGVLTKIKKERVTSPVKKERVTSPVKMVSPTWKKEGGVVVGFSSPEKQITAVSSDDKVSNCHINASYSVNDDDDNNESKNLKETVSSIIDYLNASSRETVDDDDDDDDGGRTAEGGNDDEIVNDLESDYDSVENDVSGSENEIESENIIDFLIPEVLPQSQTSDENSRAVSELFDDSTLSTPNLVTALSPVTGQASCPSGVITSGETTVTNSCKLLVLETKSQVTSSFELPATPVKIETPESDNSDLTQIQTTTTTPATPRGSSPSLEAKTPTSTQKHSTSVVESKKKMNPINYSLTSGNSISKKSMVALSEKGKSHTRSSDAKEAESEGSDVLLSSPSHGNKSTPGMLIGGSLSSTPRLVIASPTSHSSANSNSSNTSKSTKVIISNKHKERNTERELNQRKYSLRNSPAVNYNEEKMSDLEKEQLGNQREGSRSGSSLASSRSTCSHQSRADESGSVPMEDLDEEDLSNVVFVPLRKRLELAKMNVEKSENIMELPGVSSQVSSDKEEEVDVESINSSQTRKPRGRPKGKRAKTTAEDEDSTGAQKTDEKSDNSRSSSQISETLRRSARIRGKTNQ